ncbi:MAG: 4-hydroxy-3-methylbut-2-enyl diphosphate reductase [Bacteroidales bacterium]|nr:4-hydroxy-3-methylbut-2-enyl diphosphate reductase [Bacteroidales bacterium]
MKIEIDKYAGFCFGVTKAINEAEKNAPEGIACLGEIVHNAKEEQRLNSIGMKTVSSDDFEKLRGKKMLVRAHGEPPSTYENAKKYEIEIVDATCPVVLKLQQRIKSKFEENVDNTLVIFGKKGHAEVNGLVGQTNGKALVVSNIDEAMEIDLHGRVFMFSQTTSDFQKYDEIIEVLKQKSYDLHGNYDWFHAYQTICPSVKNRIPRLKEFCTKHDLIIFVSDTKSSNGKMLFGICTESNHNSFFVTGPEDIDKKWFAEASSVGISGATSTPMWLMQNVADAIKIINNPEKTHS